MRRATRVDPRATPVRALYRVRVQINREARLLARAAAMENELREVRERFVVSCCVTSPGTCVLVVRLTFVLTHVALGQ